MLVRAGCELCERTGGELLWQGAQCRVIYVEEPGYPGFCRVVCEAHVPEMTDLSEDDRVSLMSVVFAVEAVLREQLAPHKINLASLGNLVPHVHWHVIPRYLDDPHFPQPIWAQAQRAANGTRSRPDTAVLARALAAALD